MTLLVFAGALVLIFGLMAWFIYNTARKLGAREGEEEALKKASKAFEKENKEIAEKTRTTFARVPLGDQLVRKLLKKK